MPRMYSRRESGVSSDVGEPAVRFERTRRASRALRASTGQDARDSLPFEPRLSGLVVRSQGADHA